MPALPDWTSQQKLSSEKEVLGIYVTGHPLDEYSDKVAELSTHDTETLEGLERGAEVAICGILTGIQRKRNKEGKLWAAMRLEDRTGSVEAMVFSHAVRSPADRSGGGSSGAGARAGAAGRERAAQDFGAGHCAAARWRA